MDLTEGPETSANHNLTPGKYPKEHVQVKYLLITACVKFYGHFFLLSA
jgi:hypothetical protein